MIVCVLSDQTSITSANKDGGTGKRVNTDTVKQAMTFSLKVIKVNNQSKGFLFPIRKGNAVDAVEAIITGDNGEMYRVRLNDTDYQLQLIAWTDVDNTVGAGSIFQVVADEHLMALHDFLLKETNQPQISIHKKDGADDQAYELWAESNMTTKKCSLIFVATPTPTATPTPMIIRFNGKGGNAP